MDLQNQTFSGAISTVERPQHTEPLVPRGEVFDCQWHWYPSAVCEALSGREAYPRVRRAGDGFLFEQAPGETWSFPAEYVELDRQLEIMSASGIDAALVSPVIAADVSGLELGDARELCLLFNEEVARAQRAHAGRIYGLAVLPMQDAAAAIETLEDAVERLGLRGAVLHSNVDGGSVADRELWPVYERAQALDVPLFLHPTRTAPPPRIRDFALEHPLSYMFETTIAALSLIVGGVLDAYPGLTLVHPHLGGTLPYLVDRIDVYRRQGRWQLERPVAEYLPSFYTDTVSESAGGLRLAIETYGVGRLLFASDFPYFPPADGIRFVADNLAPADANQVFAGNARQLLRLAAPLASDPQEVTESWT